MFSLYGWGPTWPGYTTPYTLLVNDGTGAFTNVSAKRLPPTAVSGGASCEAGDIDIDIDVDGDLDLVAGSWDPTTWTSPGVPLKLLNDGQGFFTDASAQLPAAPIQASVLRLRDFDGDDDLDVVAMADYVHWYPGTPGVAAIAFANDGNGHFSDVTAARLPTLTPLSLPELEAYDVDHDGDLVGNGLLQNDGSGTFAIAPSPATHCRSSTSTRTACPRRASRCLGRTAHTASSCARSTSTATATRTSS